MWEFIFGLVVGTVGTIIVTIMFVAVMAATALDPERISKRNRKDHL